MKSVLITGAARGLGYALFRLYDGAGWQTFPIVRTRDDANRLVSEAKSDACVPIIGDLTEVNIERNIADLLNRAGCQLDLLINNAGIFGRSSGLQATEPEEVAALFDVHCLGALRVCRGAIHALRASGSGRIVNISSRLGSMNRNANGEFAGRGFSYSYRIAKAAQNMLSLCLAEEFGPLGISVSVVHPGCIKSGGASSEADLSPEEAAQRLYSWIERDASRGVCKYIEPGVGGIAW